MAPVNGKSRGPVFRRDEERKTVEIVEELFAEYDKNGGSSGSSPRPTIRLVVAKLQSIRNHAVARQRKRYLEALAEKVLDERAAALAQAQERDANADADADADVDAVSIGDHDGAYVDTAGFDPDLLDTDMENVAAPDAAEAAQGAPTEAQPPAETPERRLKKRPRTANGEVPERRRKRRRQRRRHEDEGSDSESEDNRAGDDNSGSGRPFAPTPIPADGPRPGDVGGLDDVLQKLMRLVWMPLRCGAALQRSGRRSPREAVLLYGPSGCGKTMLAQVVAAELRVPFFSVTGPELIGGVSGESEGNIRAVFDAAAASAPSLVFIDQIEAVVGKQGGDGDSSKGSMEMRMALTLGGCMDRLQAGETGQKGGDSSSGHVVVLAATNRADSLNPMVRRRFSVEIALGVPNEEARARILAKMTSSRGLRLAPDVDLRQVARLTPGFVGGDLLSVVQTVERNEGAAVLDAALQRLRARDGDGESSELADIERDYRLANAAADADEIVPDEDAPGISAQLFYEAARTVVPAAKREGFSTIPDTTWAQVGAMTTLRRELEASVIGPIRYPEKYAAVGLRPEAGILLWGPPGCGKTLVAKAVANESKANFISVGGPELVNKYVGESERALRQLFARARSMAPCIIFFDEIDALAAKRDDARSDGSARIVNTLLTELDGVAGRSGLFVMAATNRPDIIDPALKRPGRFGDIIFVGPPTPPDRVAILQTLYRNALPNNEHEHDDDDDDLAKVALDERCTGFSGADLEHLLRAAGKHSLTRTDLRGDAMPRITAEDWEAVLATMHPSTSREELRRYEALKYK